MSNKITEEKCPVCDSLLMPDGFCMRCCDYTKGEYVTINAVGNSGDCGKKWKIGGMITELTEEVKMKSDYQKFIELYKSFGIELKSEPSLDGDGAHMVKLKEGSHPKLIGFNNFFSRVWFDHNGKFIEQGFWE